VNDTKMHHVLMFGQEILAMVAANELRKLNCPWLPDRVRAKKSAQGKKDIDGKLTRGIFLPVSHGKLAKSPQQS